MDKIKQQSRWLWLLLSLLLALAVLLGAVQAFGVREDPRQAMDTGALRPDERELADGTQNAGQSM